MSKKNKPKVKPAVGSPAAGSNNKREKPKQQKPKKQPVYPEKAAKPSKPVKEQAVKKEKPVREKKPEKEKAKREKEKQLNIKAVVIAAASVGITAAVVLIATLVFGNSSLPGSVKNAEFKGRLEPDSVATESSLSEAQQEKLAKSVKAKGNTGAFDFYVNDEISLQEHSDPALLEFGNNSSNDCILVAFLLDENGEVIYRSLGVEPGEEIRSVELFDAVSYGTQTATLAVNGYDADTYEKIGTQTVKIKLKIGVDSVEK